MRFANVTILSAILALASATPVPSSSGNATAPEDRSGTVVVGESLETEPILKYVTITPDNEKSENSTALERRADWIGYYQLHFFRDIKYDRVSLVCKNQLS